MIATGAAKYRNISSQSGVENASPHRLIQMLFDGALDRIYKAQGHMERGEISDKGEAISSAISIIGGLQGSLNKEDGGDIADNLDRLYSYMIERLVDANQSNNIEHLSEVSKLLLDIKAGWDGIKEEAEQLSPKAAS